jgi:hypothetical protein
MGQSNRIVASRGCTGALFRPASLVAAILTWKANCRMATSKTGSTAHDLVAALPETPGVYPQKIDLVRKAVLLVRLDEAGYRAASFLDDRILTPTTQGVWLSLERATAAAQFVDQPRPLHYILHAGHVGSTLVSRLLETIGTVLSLREPLPLRTLAEASDSLDAVDSLLDRAQFEALLDAMLRLWRRGFASTRHVVLKATSSTARVAPQLLDREPAARAIYLNLRAETYLATLLAGPNSPTDLRGHGPERMRRLVARFGPDALQPLHALSLGELAAMSWLAETLTQHDLLQRYPDRVLAMDFDALLGDVPGGMTAIATHLQIETPQGWAARLATDPALTRYSKSPDHEYSPALRAQVLEQARREHAPELRRGIAWLETLARTQVAVARLIEANR